MIGCSMDQANIVRKLQLLLLSRPSRLLKSMVLPTNRWYLILTLKPKPKPNLNLNPNSDSIKAPLWSRRRN